MSPSAPRAVLDANVPVSCLLTHGSVAWRAADHVLGRCEPILSEATFDELWEVLHRPKFDRFVDPEVRRYAFLSRVLRHAAVVALRERIRNCADPDDDRFLEGGPAMRPGHSCGRAVRHRGDAFLTLILSPVHSRSGAGIGPHRPRPRLGRPGNEGLTDGERKREPGERERWRPGASVRDRAAGNRGRQGATQPAANPNEPEAGRDPPDSPFWRVAVPGVRRWRRLTAGR